jgi:ABC-type lipoprotein release transport system permease subunit
MLVATGEPDNLIVLRKGANSDGASQIPREAARALRAMTGVARGPAGEVLASPELVNQPFIVTRDGGRENVLVRGVEPVAFQVHPSVRLTSGRPFRPKLGEVVIGAGVATRYAGARLGSDIQFGRRRWRVVGIFDSGGTAFDSEIWADVTDVQDDTRRDGYSGVRLRVAPGTDAQALVRRIEGDGRFTLEARPEIDYYRDQAETASALYVLVLTLSVIMATGAVFGALNTM